MNKFPYQPHQMSMNTETRPPGNSSGEQAYITDEQIEMIAERAAEIAVKKMADQMYRSVGKGVIEKAIWGLGVIAVGLYFFLQGKGLIK